MAKYIYPAVFTKDGEFFAVNFPDLESCYTQSDSIQGAYDMAVDVLSLTLCYLEDNGAEIAPASDIAKIKVGDGQFVSLITCDTIEYRKRYDNRAVKKTLTIPSWLNAKAEAAGVNFSAVLQDALKERLHVD